MVGLVAVFMPAICERQDWNTMEGSEERLH